MFERNTFFVDTQKLKDNMCYNLKNYYLEYNLGQNVLKPYHEAAKKLFIKYFLH